MPEADGELAQLFLGHDGRLAHKWMHYFEPYQQHFGRYRGGFVGEDGHLRPLRVLEVGVSHGGSLQLWRKYFGQQAVIFGIDIDKRCAAVDDSDLEVRVGSQTDRGFLASVVDEMGGVDIIIDDGSHVGEATAVAFSVLFPLLSEGGIYVVEDLHSAYLALYGPRRKNFIEFSKDIIDGMHAWYYLSPPKKATFAKTQVSAMHVYDSMVFLEKRRRDQPVNVQIGTQSF